jgi:hypothetical protein
MRPHLWFLFFIMCTMCFCDSNISHEIKINTGKQIKFPDSLVNLLGNEQNTGLRIVSCINGNCPKCLNELKKWMEIKDKYQYKLVFVIYTEDKVLLDYFIKKENLQISYFLDNTNSFILSNELPSNPLLQTFLLDNSNKIRLIGNPLHNSSLFQFYQAELRKATN